jgi:hypothetical protein
MHKSRGFVLLAEEEPVAGDKAAERDFFMRSLTLLRPLANFHARRYHFLRALW